MPKIVHLPQRTRCSPETGFTFDAATKRRKITFADDRADDRPGPSSQQQQHEEPSVNPMLYPQLCSREILIEHLSRTLIDSSGLESKDKSELVELAQTLCVPLPQRQRAAAGNSNHSSHCLHTPVRGGGGRAEAGSDGLSPIVSNIRHIRLMSSSDSSAASTPNKRAFESTQQPNGRRLDALRNSATDSDGGCGSPLKRTKQRSPVRFP